jgi:ribonuclease HI
MPALLHGLRIYTDTSLTPDLNILQDRNAGIGDFLFGSTEHYNLNVYIKVSLLNISSVFSAEAAALAFASTIVSRLNIMEATFLSDSQQLVSYVNLLHEKSIPRWDAKFYTQTFINAGHARSYKVYKIPRHLNATADTLATQAHRHQN